MNRILLALCLLTSAFSSTIVKAEYQGEIEFAYNSRLGRGSDPGGMAAWNNFRHNGGSQAQVYYYFAHSAEGATVVNNVYLSRLERNADPGGLANYINYNEGAGIQAVIVSISNSQEAAIDVDNIYQACLARHAEPAGLVAWQNYLISTSLNAVRVGICNSAEAIARRLNLQCSAQVAALYQTILRRNADAGGLSSFTSYCVNEDLAGRDGQAAVALALATSDEAKRNAAAAYAAVLDRAATSTEISAATTTMKSSGYSGLMAKLTSTSEASTKVTQAFDAALARVPTSSEMKTYVGKLSQDGVGIKGVRKLLSTSAEAQGLANSPLYEAIASASMLDQATSCEKLVSCPATCSKFDADCFSSCKAKHADCLN